MVLALIFSIDCFIILLFCSDRHIPPMSSTLLTSSSDDHNNIISVVVIKSPMNVVQQQQNKGRRRGKGVVKECAVAGVADVNDRPPPMLLQESFRSSGPSGGFHVLLL